MIELCMINEIEWFHLSSGEVVFVGYIEPNLRYYLPSCKGRLIVNNKEVQEITIMGEDRLIRSDREPFEGKRSVRTRDNILTIPEGADVQLKLYK